jgi:hypothetical protein
MVKYICKVKERERIRRKRKRIKKNLTNLKNYGSIKLQIKGDQQK